MPCYELPQPQGGISFPSWSISKDVHCLRARLIVHWVRWVHWIGFNQNWHAVWVLVSTTASCAPVTPVMNKYRELDESFGHIAEEMRCLDVWSAPPCWRDEMPGGRDVMGKLKVALWRSYGGFLSHAGSPKSSKLRPLKCETHGDLGIPHFRKPPYGKAN